MKIFIDDPNLRLNGKPEKELPPATRLRFEVKNKAFKIYFEDSTGMIKIQNVGDDEIIAVFPRSVNAINIV